MTIINTDILVVGAGGAGLRAALSARESAPELKVTVISRGEPGKHGVTATACSDRMAFHVSFPQSGQHLTESWRAHAIDIYAGGCYVSDPNLAELLAKESADAFYRLANLGVAFAMGPGKLPMQFITDGSRAPRACYTGPYTARDIEKALIDAVGQTDIQIIGNLALASLILNPKGEISSALCISDETDEWLTVNAKAVIIATGGPGSIFEHSVFPDRMDASAWWAALRAGATLVNLEFIQFGLSSTETSLACSGSMMRALPMLRNEKGRDLLEDVMKIAPESDPVELLFNKGSSWPVSAESSTHAVDVAVHRAIERGEDVFLDYSRNPDFVDAAYLNKMFPEIVNKWYTDRSILLRANGQPVIPYDRLEKINPQVIYWFREHGIDLKATPVRVRHAAQHFQGGILINTKAETGVPGLYACGEAAGGQHGANRPGGNALMDCQVMGHIAGTEAAKRAGAVETVPTNDYIDKSIEFLENEFGARRGLKADEALMKVSKILTNYLGVIRTPSGMYKGVVLLTSHYEKGVKKGNLSRLDALVARSAQAIGLAIAKAASRRQESRGAHLYFEHESDSRPEPSMDPEGRVWNAVREINHRPEVKVIKIPGLRK